ncbi:MAG: response regulator [Bacteroidota bacterium]
MESLQRILIVEDDPDIRSILQMSLEAVGGYTVAAAANGVEALERLATFTPDLIVLDVMMPEMDGPATLGALRQNPAFTSTPVIFLTAKAQRHEVDHYLTLGIAEVIHKPFDPVALPEQVREIWSRQYV